MTIQMRQLEPIQNYEPYLPWDIIINKQEQRIQDLLQHVTFLRTNDMMTAVKESKYVIMISDGSDKDYSMTHTWVLSTPKG